MLANHWFGDLFCKIRRGSRETKKKITSKNNWSTKMKQRKLQSKPKDREKEVVVASYGSAINSNKRRDAAAETRFAPMLIAIVEIETRFYPCLLTSHTQWLVECVCARALATMFFLPHFALNIAVGSEEKVNKHNIQHAHSKWCDIPIQVFHAHTHNANIQRKKKHIKFCTLSKHSMIAT